MLIVLLGAALLVRGCREWQVDATVQGVAFSRVRVEADGLVIGQLKADTVIGGRPCRQGWVHLTPTGVPVGFTAFREIDLGRLRIPAGTWVFQDKAGVVTVCAFPGDTEVQGHLCHGSGGPKGVQTAFYPDGALRQFFLVDDTTIDGIPCRAGAFEESVFLHENGRLKACVLAADLVRDGRTYAKGTRLRLTADGLIVR